MQRVQSYQTDDGRLFSDKAEALTHDATLKIRGVMQGNSIGRLANITITDAAQFIIRHGDEVAAILRKYKEQMRHVTKVK